MKTIQTAIESGFAMTRSRAARMIARASIATAAATLCVAAHAQTLMQPNISAAQARQIIDAIIAECSPGELLTVTIAVVDRAGQPVMQARADTASPHNWDLAYRKAYTARTFRRSTLEIRDRTAADQPLAGQRMLPDVIGLGGGVPILLHGDGIGGIGVSGAQGGQEGDNACALAGLAAIADQLE